MAKEEKPKKRFWTRSRTLILIIFLAGLLIGALITNQFLDPVLTQTTQADFNALLAENSELNQQLDTCLSCLSEHEINPISCKKT